MYLLILESIGMQELLLVGIVALIVFGPRKLPEMAKMIGKTMAEFRRVTGEFKETWEKEANFEADFKAEIEDKKEISLPRKKSEKIIEPRKVDEISGNVNFLPEIREIKAADFEKEIIGAKNPVEQVKMDTDKKSWL